MQSSSTWTIARYNMWLVFLANNWCFIFANNSEVYRYCSPTHETHVRLSVEVATDESDLKIDRGSLVRVVICLPDH